MIKLKIAGLPDSLLKKEILPDMECLTPTRAKPEFGELSPKWGPSEDTEAAKVFTEVAGQLVSAMADLSSKVDSHIRNSPKIDDHGDCKLPCLSNAASPKFLPSPRTFNGFSNSDIINTAAPDDLLKYLRSKDANTGVSSGTSVPGGHQHSGTAPPPPAGMHVHQFYVDDAACHVDDGPDYSYQKRRCGAYGEEATSTSSGEEEEEIRVQEHRETVVTMGRKRTKVNGKPFGNKPKMQKKI